MKLFLKKSNGVITVLVTLILVPTIFLCGFMTDLIRIKMLSNQAMMAADNYGNTVLSRYDNLLKQVYGLFAVSQESNTDSILDKYKSEILASFDLDGSSIHIKLHDQAEELHVIKGRSLGWIPYKNAGATLNRSYIDGANLSNTDVLATQLSDFMKLRIAQELFDNTDDVIDAVKEVNNSKDNIDVTNKKVKYDEAAQDALEKVQKYYLACEKMNQVSDNVRELYSRYDGHRSAIELSIKTEQKIEKERDAEIERIDKHNEEIKKENEEHADDDDYEEQEPEPYPNWYPYDKLELRKKLCSGKFNSEINGMKQDLSVKDPSVSHSGKPPAANSCALEIQMCEAELGKSLKTLQGKETELRNELNNASNVDKELKAGIETELQEYDKMLNSESGNIEKYREITDFLGANAATADIFHSDASNNIQSIRTITSGFLSNAASDGSGLPTNIYDNEKWNYIKESPNYLLYQSLNQYFTSDNDKAKKGRQKQNQAEDLQKEQEKILEKEEEPDPAAHDIPASLKLVTDANGDGKEKQNNSSSSVGKFLGLATSFFGDKDNSPFRRLLTKFYAMEYDFGMFTNRTTNVSNDKDSHASAKQEKTLTGIELTPDNNYLYRAEVEYVLVGNRSAKKNLNVTRDRIVAFRALMNYIASYQIADINAAIKGISDPIKAANPLIGIGVEAALRIAFTTAETAYDWNELKDAGKVTLRKTTTGDCLALSALKDVLSDSDENVKAPEKKGSSNGIKLSYKDYVMVMILFFTSYEKVIGRTGDLITVNMNYFHDSSMGSQTFFMEKAHTAVASSCSVKSSFTVLPESFAQQVAPSQYSGISSMENGTYQFKVIRGY